MPLARLLSEALQGNNYGYPLEARKGKLLTAKII